MFELMLRKERKLITTLLLAVLLLPASLYAQRSERAISGTVTDELGEPLVGVIVLEVGIDNNGTTTDPNGQYQLTLKSANPKVKFSYVGFKDQELTISSDQKIVNVTLKEDVDFLDEVVVVGFGTQKKASVVGSISTVEPQLLQTTPVRSISNNLAGKLSGVLAVQRSGNPYSNNSDFWIRGISTFSGNARPLVLIDGVERTLNDIDPHEVETISVLKDAAASAVYGVRGANGVIMITTKRGVVGKPTVTVRAEQAMTQPTKLPQYVDAVKYIEILNEASYNTDPNKKLPFDEATIMNYRNNVDPELYPNVNWWDLISNDFGYMTTAGLDINGGSEVLRYALTAGYYDEKGILKRDKTANYDSSLKVRRFTVRSNIDVNLTSTTLFRFNLGGFLQNYNGNPGDTDERVFFVATQTPPHLHPHQYADGRIPKLYAKTNPWAFVTQSGYRTTSATRLESLASLEQKLDFITPGLSAKILFSFDRFAESGVERTKDPDYYLPATGRDENGRIIAQISSNGQQFLGHNKTFNWGRINTYFESALNYNQIFDNVHEINSMLLYNQREVNDGDKIPYRHQGLAGRLSYTYDRRYIGEFNFGYNGSENFAKGKRFGFFPSVSLGWIITQEDFMQPYVETLSNLKIRASWGKAGNSDIGGQRFAYISTINSPGGYGYHWGTEANFYRAGLAEDNIGVSDLTWETSTKSNIGLDIGLLNNSIQLTMDYFTDLRENIFMRRQSMPGSAGFMKTPWANYGKVFNNGFDGSLRVNKSFSEDLFLVAFANFTYAHNHIIEIDEPESVKGTTRARTGHPIGQQFGFIAERLFTEDDFVAHGQLSPDLPKHTFSSVKPGDIMYRDLNGDKQITELDMTAIGKTDIPEIVYGFGATINYKAVDFGFFFQGTGNVTRILGGDNWIPGQTGGSLGNILANVDDRWTQENPRQDVFWPRLSYSPNDNNLKASTWWQKDMSFIRLKSLELGYQLPKDWINRAGMSNLRLFLRGSNLFTLSDFKLWDPELATTDGTKYPMTRSFSAGITINFK